VRYVTLCNKMLGGPLLWGGASCSLIYAIAQLCQPLLLRSLILSMQDPDDVNGWHYVVGLLVTSLVGAFSNQLHLHMMFRGTRSLTLLACFHIASS